MRQKTYKFFVNPAIKKKLRKNALTLDIPVFNKDGTIQFTQTISEAEGKELLTFALNFLVATGLATNVSITPAPEKQPLND